MCFFVNLGVTMSTIINLGVTMSTIINNRVLEVLEKNQK
jgi:hypothetical protein